MGSHAQPSPGARSADHDPSSAKEENPENSLHLHRSPSASPPVRAPARARAPGRAHAPPPFSTPPPPCAPPGAPSQPGPRRALQVVKLLQQRPAAVSVVAVAGTPGGAPVVLGQLVLSGVRGCRSQWLRFFQVAYLVLRRPGRLEAPWCCPDCTGVGPSRWAFQVAKLVLQWPGRLQAPWCCPECMAADLRGCRDGVHGRVPQRLQGLSVPHHGRRRAPRAAGAPRRSPRCPPSGGAAERRRPLGLHPEGRSRARRASGHHQGKATSGSAR